MLDPFSNIKLRIEERLYESAIHLLPQSLERFHQLEEESPEDTVSEVLPELVDCVNRLLAVMVAKRCFCALLPRAAPELRAILAHPETIPRSANLVHWKKQLSTADPEWLPANERVHLFGLLYPEQKQPLHTGFQVFLSVAEQVRREMSLLHPNYLLAGRMAWLTIEVFNALKSSGIFDEYAYRLSTADLRFMNEYNEARVQRVDYALYCAGKKKKAPAPGFPARPAGRWEQLANTCPVCDETGLLNGYSELEETATGLHLTFYATGFDCSGCGLQLWDLTELFLAQAPAIHSRDKELEEWLAENGLSI